MNWKSVLWHGCKVVFLGTVAGLVLAVGRLAVTHLQAPPGPPPSVGSLPSPNTYVPSPENSAQLGRYLDGVLSFVLLHEIGHMIISENSVPVLGREEDAADRFAVMFLSQDANPAQRAALVSTPLFFNGMHRLAGPAGYDWTNEHGEPQQRGFSILCLMYGSNPEKYAQLGAQMGVSQDRLQQCVIEAGKNGKDWREVYLAHANTTDKQVLGISVPRIAVVYEPVPPSAAESLWGSRQIVMDGKILEAVAENMAHMKLPPVSEMLRSISGRNALKQNLFSIDKVLELPRPGVNNRTAGDDLSSFDYVVRGDACLDGKGNPEANAYWNSGSRTLTLCYALVNLVVNVGKAQIVEHTAGGR